MNSTKNKFILSISFNIEKIKIKSYSKKIIICSYNKDVEFKKFGESLCKIEPTMEPHNIMVKKFIRILMNFYSVSLIYKYIY